MIDIYELYSDALDRINKEENGYLKTGMFNRLVNRSSVNFMSDTIGNLQSANHVDQHQYYYDLLFPFNSQAILAVKKGIADAPGDYAHFASLRVRFDQSESLRQLIDLNNLLCEAEDDPTIDRVLIDQQIADIQSEERYTAVVVYPHDKLTRRLTSAIPSKRPSEKKPVAEYASSGWKIYPSSTASALLVYYRKPVAAKLIMQVDPTTNDLVYDPQSSVSLDWPEKAKEGLIKKIVDDWAIYVRETELFQLNEAPKA